MYSTNIEFILISIGTWFCKGGGGSVGKDLNNVFKHKAYS